MGANRRDFGLLWLVGFLSLGAFLRLYRLGAQSLWLDELFSRSAALEPTLWETILKGSVRDMFPPIFPAITHYAVRLPGAAEMVFRLPSALAGIASIAVMYLLGRALHSTRLGSIAAAVTSCHWFAVFYSQEGRPYSALFLCSTLIAYLATRVVDDHLRSQSTLGALLGLGFCGLFASYLHYIGLLFFMMSGGVLLVLTRLGKAPLRGVLVTYTAVGLAYLPWVGVVLDQISRRKLDKEPPRLGAIVRTYSELSAAHPVWFVLLLGLGWLAWRKANQGSDVLLARGTARFDPASESEVRFRTQDLVKLLIVWVTLPVLVTWSISHLVVPIYTHRNMIVILPAFVLLAALALAQIDRAFTHGQPWTSGSLIALLLIDLVMIKSTYSAATKEPFRQMAQRVLAAQDGSDVAVWVQPSHSARHVDQYFEILESPVRVQSPDASGQPRGRPAVLWILARKVAPTAPQGYAAVEVMRHEPDHRLPWAGERMTLIRCQRLATP